MTNWKRKITFTLVIIGMTVGIVEGAYADEFKLTPSVAVKTEYNDNIFYTSTDTEKDFLATISPGLALTARTERLSIFLSGILDQRLYLRNSKLNTIDQHYEETIRYAFTPRLNVSGKALYSVTSSPDRDFETTGLSLTTVQRKRQNYTVSSDYVLSEKTMTTFSYDYLNDNYDRASSSDLESHTFNLGFIRDMSDFIKSTKARMNTGYSNYSVSGMKVDNYEATIGIDHAFNEKWTLLFDTGPRYTISETRFTELEPVPSFVPFPHYDLTLVEKRKTSRGWGVVGQLALTYKGERDSGNLNLSHDISPASGYSGSTERTSFAFSMSRRFTYELFGTLTGGYYINKSSAGEFSAQKIDENMMRISPGIRYEFDKDKSLEASYTYNRTRYNVTHTDAQRNLFQIRFRAQHHLFE
jgi:predicted porin